MKFKVGDLVRINEIVGPEHWRGKAGVCIEILPASTELGNGYHYKVLIGDERKVCFYENELELMNKGSGNE